MPVARVGAVFTVSVVKFCPFGGMSSELLPRKTVGPTGLRVVLSVTSPVKLFRLVAMICELPVAPRIICSVVGFALIVKLGTPGRLLKLAVWTVSGTGVIPPLLIVMHRGGSLVGALGDPQPVWKPTGVVEAVPVIL